jgi:hypothetical protein
MRSNHANAGLLIRRGLYDNLHSFAELEQRISALGDENSKAVGDAFEVFVEGYLATHQKLQAEAVWLVGQVPQDIRQQMNLPNDAKGIDGIPRRIWRRHALRRSEAAEHIPRCRPLALLLHLWCRSTLRRSHGRTVFAGASADSRMGVPTRQQTHPPHNRRVNLEAH